MDGDPGGWGLGWPMRHRSRWRRMAFLEASVDKFTVGTTWRGRRADTKSRSSEKELCSLYDTLYRVTAPP